MMVCMILRWFYLGETLFHYHYDKEASKEVYSEMVDFFSEFLYDCHAWSKDGDFIYERGAWVRCYGVPLHAWNPFFSCLVFDCGRVLKVDEVSSKKLQPGWYKMGG